MNAPGSTGDPTVTADERPPLSATPQRLIVSLDVTCTGATAFVHAQTSAPVDDLELRAYPDAKVGEFGRAYVVRTVYDLDPLLRAPGSKTFPWSTMLPVGAQTCDDFTAGLEDLRATVGGRTESYPVVR